MRHHSRPALLRLYRRGAQRALRTSPTRPSIARLVKNSLLAGVSPMTWTVSGTCTQTHQSHACCRAGPQATNSLHTGRNSKPKERMASGRHSSHWPMS